MTQIILELYNDGEFRVVFGYNKENNALCVGMRWDKTASGATNGYPTTRSGEGFFILSENLVLGFLGNLLNSSDKANKKEILKAIGKLID